MVGFWSSGINPVKNMVNRFSRPCRIQPSVRDFQWDLLVGREVRGLVLGRKMAPDLTRWLGFGIWS